MQKQSLKEVASGMPSLEAATILKLRTMVLEEIVREAVKVVDGLWLCSYEYEEDVGEAILEHFGLTRVD